MGRLEGKIAVITGANSGIGLASAKRFVAEGAHVYIPGRRQEELDKAAEALGAGVTAVQGDVSNLDDLDRLFSKVRSDHGHVDVLMANAGLGALEPLGKITEAAFDLVFRGECQRHDLHRAKGTSADAGRRLHHPHGIDDGLDGNAGVQHLQREQGGDPQSRPQLGARPQGHGNPRQRAFAWAY